MSGTDLMVAMADLNASRARLREVLLPPRPDPNAPQSKGFSLRGLSSIWRSWKHSAGGSPALMIALDALQSWWVAHPWRQIGRSVAAPLSVAALPLVRRHPWAALIVASVAGALLVKTRPWRWGLVARQAHSVRRQAVRWALGQATSPAVQALIAAALAGLVSKMSQKKDKSAERDVRADPPGDAPSATTAANGQFLHTPPSSAASNAGPVAGAPPNGVRGATPLEPFAPLDSIAPVPRERVLQ